jgi:UDP-3-O-[3-hydroxymyristoyl] glucosamine N-acyltransferase
MKWSLTIEEVLKLIGSTKVVGQYQGQLTGLADLRQAGPGDLSFLSGGKYTKFLSDSNASVILVPADQEGEPKEGQAWLPNEDPSNALTAICSHIEAILLPDPITGIHPTAIIDPSAELDPTVAVGPYCIVGEGVKIGRGTILESNVRVERGAVIGEDTFLSHGAVVGWGCQVGNRCRLFQGSVIGADGFGYRSDQTGHHAVPQIGIVIIEDDVDLGAHTCIDRARFAATKIGRGSKLDNLVQVGHNNIIGKHNIICAQVGMAGSNELGDFCVLAGQVGVAGHLKIGAGVTGTGQTGISYDVPAGTVLSGTPGRPHRQMMKQQVRMSHLDDLFARVKALENAAE